MNRLYHLPERSIVKKVYNVLENPHLRGFTTWITKVRELIHNYNLNVEMDSESFKRACKGAVSNKFIEDWNAELNDTQKNPLLRTYKQIKTEFTMEPYLDLVQNYRYRKPSAVSEPVPILWQWNMEDTTTFHLIWDYVIPAAW